LVVMPKRSCRLDDFPRTQSSEVVPDQCAGTNDRCPKRYSIARVGAAGPFVAKNFQLYSALLAVEVLRTRFGAYAITF